MTDDILNRSDWDKGKRAQRIISELWPIFENAEPCGVDCTAHRKIAEDFAKTLGEIEKRFLTPTPKN